MQFFFDRAHVADAVVDATHRGIAALHEIRMAYDVEHVAVVFFEPNAIISSGEIPRARP